MTGLRSAFCQLKLFMPSFPYKVQCKSQFINTHAVCKFAAINTTIQLCCARMHHVIHAMQYCKHINHVRNPPARHLTDIKSRKTKTLPCPATNSACSPAFRGARINRPKSQIAVIAHCPQLKIAMSKQILHERSLFSQLFVRTTSFYF